MSARVVRIRKAADRDPTWSDEAVAHAEEAGVREWPPFENSQAEPICQQSGDQH